jgi:hypothetical protein
LRDSGDWVGFPGYYAGVAAGSKPAGSLISGRIGIGVGVVVVLLLLLLLLIELE